MPALLKSNLEGIKLLNRGKVRDVYELEGHLLIVASDRISAFDVVMPNGIPDKGKILTALSLFWFEVLRGETPHHLVTANVGLYPAPIGPQHRSQLVGRSMLVKKARPLPVECIVRGYLAGSGWKEYKAQGTVCGIRLPAGLKESAKLPEPVFTPSTKAVTGHDENISFEEVIKTLGKETAEKVRSLSLKIFHRASELAESRGVIIADTKFEFGWLDNEIILIDEVLTPDSSRFWLMSEYEPGRSQNAFDKQYVRDYLETLHWDKTPPGPELPEEVVMKTRQKYMDAFKLITGKEWNQ